MEMVARSVAVGRQRWLLAAVANAGRGQVWADREVVAQ